MRETGAAVTQQQHFEPSRVQDLLDIDAGYAAAMDRILRDCGFAGLDTVIDFGCARGQWTSALSAICGRVIGLDVTEASLDRARAAFAEAGAGNAEFANVREHALDSLPPVDGLTCMDVLPLMAGSDMHALFRFARDHLPAGAPLLCTSRNPKLLLDWLLTGERFRYEGFVAGLRKYASLGGHVLRSLGRRPVPDAPSARYLTFPESTIRLAESHGFELLRDPGAMRALDAVHVCEPTYAGPNRRFSHIDWYLFAKT